MEQPQKIEELFRRYLKDECSREEVQLLLQYFNADENKDLLKRLILAELESMPEDDIDMSPGTKAKMDELLNRIQTQIRKKK